MAKVILKNLTKKFEDVVAVNNMNSTVEDKAFVVLVGPSGCGKTTVLRTIAGLEEATEGDIYIGDRLVNDIAPKDRDIAMVFQNYALYPHFNKIIIMKDGIVQQTGKPQEVYDHPNNMFVAGFIGSPAMNFLDAAITDRVTLKGGMFELNTADRIKKVIKDNNLIGKEIVLGIRPEDLEDNNFVQNIPANSTITANVEVTEPMGSEIYVYVDIEGILITARVNPKSKFRSGEKASLYVDIDKIQLFDKDTEKSYI